MTNANTKENIIKEINNTCQDLVLFATSRDTHKAKMKNPLPNSCRSQRETHRNRHRITSEATEVALHNKLTLFKKARELDIPEKEIVQEIIKHY